MILTLIPIRADDPAPVLARKGEVLMVNGTPHDFAPLPEGAVLPRAAVPGGWLASDVTRQDGVLRLALFLPHGPLPFPAPDAARRVTHPDPVEVWEDGPVALPAWNPPAPDAPFEDPFEGGVQ